MFEGLSEDAWHALVAAQHEATLARKDQVGCEHLMIALVSDASSPAGQAARAAGLDPAGLRSQVAPRPAEEGRTLDADALASVGIDLDTVRRAAEAAYGPGALDRGRLPVTPGRRRRHRIGKLLGDMPLASDTKKSLELALRAATRGHQDKIQPSHLLIGIIDQGSNAALALITAAGADAAALRADVLRRITPAA